MNYPVQVTVKSVSKRFLEQLHSEYHWTQETLDGAEILGWINGEGIERGNHNDYILIEKGGEFKLLVVYIRSRTNKTIAVRKKNDDGTFSIIEHPVDQIFV